MPRGKTPTSSTGKAYDLRRAGCRVAPVPVPFATLAESFFRPALAGLVPYEPGKPVEEVQRELGLERVVKLASNEGSRRTVPGGPGGARARRLAS